MTAARRWWTVGIGVLVLVCAPVLVRALPVRDAGASTMSATDLLRRVQASRDASFSGLVETAGNVALPDNDTLSGLTNLVGDTNRVRVWWRDPRTWRLATLRTTGETDVVHSGSRQVRWVYESKRATLSADVPVRLPDTVDVLPNELARRSLAGARPGELSRIPARRVAGRDALGLRLRPSDEQAAVSRVDVYVDRETGVPLEVELFARGVRLPSLTTRFSDFSAGRPPASTLRFDPPDDARLRYDRVVDLAAAADRFSSRVPPETLAGLRPRRSPSTGGDTLGGAFQGSVGVYGRGPTVLIAVPLWDRTASRVSRELEGRPGVRQVDEGLLLGAPPLRLLLSEPEPNGTRWLLAGTVTEATLTRASQSLVQDRPGLRGQLGRAAAGVGS